MRFRIKHDIPGRLRVGLCQRKMSYEEADIIQFHFQNMDGVNKVKVYHLTCDVVVEYETDRQTMIERFAEFDYGKTSVPELYIKNSGRKLNAEYKEKLILKVVFRYMRKLLMPWPLRTAFVLCKSVGYLHKAAVCLRDKRLEVPVLDAAAITTSMARRNFSTAGSIMFLLGIGELLEEWTYKKSVGDLARNMVLNVDKVWIVSEGEEILVDGDKVSEGDMVVVRMGSVIPFDGEVERGEAMVNQAMMTGEPMAVRKAAGSYVYAGTVQEEGEIHVRVKAVKGSTRFEKIVTMIEETEKLKSASEGKAEHLADKLVPYTLGGALLTWALTRSAPKALAVLMVDFSCALKLAIPISVLSAIREADSHDMTIKGGKYMEAVAEADTVVLDKTGTLTEARPRVKGVVSFNGEKEDEVLRIAACLEEHFPHSIARAVVAEAKHRKLEHEELHSKIHYIVAHGIASEIEGRKIVLGSYHFVIEDERCRVPEKAKEKFENLPPEYSHLYMGVAGRLEAAILIEDPLRETAREAVRALREEGVEKIVMMTGDSERTAASIAEKVGVDEYYSEVLPEEKAGFVKREREKGKIVMMIGDGINDSPALSAANVGIAVSDGTEMARETADITIGSDSLWRIVHLRRLSVALMDRIKYDYRGIIGVNGALICLGLAGVLAPTTSAWMHNISTLMISLKSMTDLMDDWEER